MNGRSEGQKKEETNSSIFSGAAKQIVSSFLGQREELWHDCRPLASMTLQTQAEQLLQTYSADLIERVMRHVMRQFHSGGRTAPYSLMFCRISLQNEAARVQSSSKRDPNSRFVDAMLNEGNRWRLRLKDYRKSGFWMTAQWGPKPGEQGCRCPRDILVEPQ